MRTMVYLPDVVTLELIPEKCTGCGLCLEVCPHQVLALDDGRARIVDRDACMECGACALNCPFEAITVQTGVGCAAALIKSGLGRGKAEGGVCC
jgi:ferredoxin